MSKIRRPIVNTPVPRAPKSPIGVNPAPIKTKPPKGPKIGVNPAPPKPKPPIAINPAPLPVKPTVNPVPPRPVKPTVNPAPPKPIGVKNPALLNVIAPKTKGTKKVD